MLLTEFRSLITSPKKGGMLMTVGIPGSGKSTTLRGLLAGLNHTVINADLVREELLGDASSMEKGGWVWDTIDERYGAAIRSDTPYVALDFMNLRARDRKKYILPALSLGRVVHLLFFPIEAKRAIYHQSLRGRRVPGHVIEEKANKMQMASEYEINNCKVYIVRWSLD